MAGGRLSIDDRRSIAAGMAEGLSYAEIGRRIGRPTSTVSREVARNGHRSYAPQRAQDAARHPSRRHDDADIPAAPADLRREYVDELAAYLAATGMSKTSARVFADLMTADSGLTAADLVRGLRVSPASVSKTIRALEDMDLVERRSEPGSRRERYSVADDVWTRAVRADSSGHAGVADVAERGIAVFGAETVAGMRLARMGRFFGDLSEQMQGAKVGDPGMDDAGVLVAALGCARRPMAPAELASALGWAQDRIDAALDLLKRRPLLADPFLLHQTEAGYELGPRPDRLSREQRDALAGIRPDYA
ncbi:GbsR/MarR family transcriptional regulator [Microbacterium sp. ASV49]|uniref:Helix-turn-helix domain-containing protein n=1 Tax=Microbacterium candidum TaxID=3041922 RepID=A0ABT7N162_9MICO|nr:helix-turn-helix domain-containing protein [Microbacterium sp. ASV49]MDL9980437.1 helix-turn-helix domain-containing protein [Microbacterium sp. ASV49]